MDLIKILQENNAGIMISILNKRIVINAQTLDNKSQSVTEIPLAMYECEDNKDLWLKHNIIETIQKLNNPF